MKTLMLIILLSMILISSSEDSIETRIERLRSAPLNAVTAASENDMIVATDFSGLLKSSNFGNTFDKLNAGLSGPNRLFENNFTSIDTYLYKERSSF